MSTSVNAQQIPIDMLLLDKDNYRLDGATDQHSVLANLIDDQGEKLIKLAEHILFNGTSPMENFLVRSVDDSSGRYIVQEGNRRLAALKILHCPDLLDNTPLARKKSFLIQKIEQSAHSPEEEVNCVIIEDPDEASKWIGLKHTGENDGVGVVGWNTNAKSRFDEDQGKSNYNAQARVLRSFLEKRGHTFDNQYPISNISRLISTPSVRDALGIRCDGGNVFAYCSASALEDSLLTVFNDLQDKSVKEIYHASDRRAYIDQFDFRLDSVPEWLINSFSESSNEGGNHVSTGSEPITPPTSPTPPAAPENTQSPTPTLSPRGQSTAPRTPPNSHSRATLIPRGYNLNISSPKVLAIFRELKSLDLNRYLNCAGVMFRVFIELSVDNYIDTHDLCTKNLNRDSALTAKIQNVADSMKSDNLLHKNKLTPVYSMISAPTSYMSINNLHAYVHSTTCVPFSKELLNTMWDNLTPFIEKLWE